MPLRKALCVLIVPLTLQALPAAASDESQLSVGGNMQYDWLHTDENDTLTQCRCWLLVLDSSQENRARARSYNSCVDSR